MTDNQPVVCIQGLGFVGAAMAVAVAAATDVNGSPCYKVIGVDLPNDVGKKRINALVEGKFPFETTDGDLKATLEKIRTYDNLAATTDTSVYKQAAVTVVDVPLDVDWERKPPSLRLEGFKAAISQLGASMSPGSLILIETTVPPGTTENVIVPLVDEALEKRGLLGGSINIAHSYERVMPGKDYFDSIVNFWRVYAGQTDAAAKACAKFLETIINTEEYPLTRLDSPTASELGKVLENAYRATNIAFMEEWGRFAESVGVDIFQVVDAIRVRPTHNNIRTPGFGVGGYCLTKDPLFGTIASREIFDLDLEFPLSTKAIELNQHMPLVSVERLEELLGGLAGKSLLVLGISYREDVGDTRYSPTEIFYRAAVERGATIAAYDPLVDYWEELKISTEAAFPCAAKFDAVVLAVPHEEFRQLDYVSWLGDSRPLIFDGFNVLSKPQRNKIREIGCRVESVGRGDGL